MDLTRASSRNISPPDDWLPIARLVTQFEANFVVLSDRYPSIAQLIEQLPASTAMIRVRGDVIDLAFSAADGMIETAPNPVPAASAAIIVNQLFPGGSCTQPVLVAGLDQAWLWLCLYALQISTPTAPGHRPPLYLLCGSIDRLRTILHVHDLRPLLADPRVSLFCGPDAVRQFEQAAIATPRLPLPRLSVTVEPQLWSDQSTLDTTLRSIGVAWENSFALQKSRLQELDARFHAPSLASRIRGGSPLRILGLTSLYTTFLQYSMRDWLQSLRSLGHETRLLIESENHEQINPLDIAAVSADFQPDLIVLIDHFRAAIVGLPQRIPAVMWIQDRLPHLFRDCAGKAQTAADYTIGQGRTECVHALGYPAHRFMPAMIGTNSQRFEFEPTGDADAKCDVSFVSHASTPADVMIQAEIDRLGTPQAARLLRGIFDQFQAIYASGDCVTQPLHIEALIRRTMLETQTTVPDPRPLLDFFTHKINNALFRHQAIDWVAETGVSLRLHGKGWETHRRFGRYAHGVADNERTLAAIYRTSRINLQITPFGAAHQRLFDGLAAGGFFLMRRCPGDRFDQVLRELFHWCEERQITDDHHLLRDADDSVHAWVAELERIDGRSVLGRGYDFVAELRVTAHEGFVRSAGTLWPEFNEVSFASKSELQQKLNHFLAAPQERIRIASEMRRKVVESLTYRAISQRMLAFIAGDIESTAMAQAA